MTFFKDKLVLVTGGAGFIGSHIVDKLMAKEAKVRVLDDMSNGSKQNIEQWLDNKDFELVVGDIRNRNDVKNAMKDVSIVYHEAAKVSVPVSVKEPHLVMDVNSLGTTMVLDECRKQDVEKFVVASSSSVYGDTPTLPKVEDMPTLPLSPYAVSKLTQEKLALAFHSTYGLNTTALRYFNVYGPRQRGGSYAGVISLFIKNAFQDTPLTIEGDGGQTRDFTFIEDVAECNLLCAANMSSEGKAYNVGAGGRTSIKDLALEIIKIVNSKSKLDFTDPRIGDVRDSLASIEEAKKDFGYSPSYDISQGLEKTIEWAKISM